MLGTYALSSGYYDAYYGQAQKVRTLIARDFERGLRPGRRAGLADHADHRVPDRRAGRRPDGDVPQPTCAPSRPTWPASPAISVPCGLAAEDGLPVGLQIMAPALADDRLLPGRRPRSRPPSPSAGATRCWPTPTGPASLSAASDATKGAADDRPHSCPTTRRWRATSRSSAWRPTSSWAPRPKMFCGCPTDVRRRAEHPDLPGLPGPARRRCRWSTRTAIEYAIRIGLALNCSIADVVPVRAEELLLPGHAEELPDLPVRRAAVHRRAISTSRSRRRDASGSASSGSTWRRTPASRCTSAGPPAASTAPTTRWSTTTGPASRWSRSSPSRSPAPARWPPRWPGPTSPSCATSCARSASPTSGWSRARCAATSTPRSPRPGRPSWGTRTETKNVNSLRSVERAVRSEIERQAAVLDAGGTIMQETRHFHEDTGITTSGPEQGRGRRLPVLPRARPGAAGPGRRSGSSRSRRTLPELPAGPPRPAAGRAGPVRRRAAAALRNAGASTLVADTVAAGAPAGRRPQVVAGLSSSRRANDARASS